MCVSAAGRNRPVLLAGRGPSLSRRRAASGSRSLPSPLSPPGVDSSVPDSILVVLFPGDLYQLLPVVGPSAVLRCHATWAAGTASQARRAAEEPAGTRALFFLDNKSAEVAAQGGEDCWTVSTEGPGQSSVMNASVAVRTGGRRGRWVRKKGVCRYRLAGRDGHRTLHLHENRAQHTANAKPSSSRVTSGTTASRKPTSARSRYHTDAETAPSLGSHASCPSDAACPYGRGRTCSATWRRSTVQRSRRSKLPRVLPRQHGHPISGTTTGRSR